MGTLAEALRRELFGTECALGKGVMENLVLRSKLETATTEPQLGNEKGDFMRSLGYIALKEGVEFSRT